MAQRRLVGEHHVASLVGDNDPVRQVRQRLLESHAHAFQFSYRAPQAQGHGIEGSTEITELSRGRRLN